MKDHSGSHLRETLKALLGIIYPTPKDLRRACEALEIPYETARQAKDYGKGSVDTINGLILHGLGIEPDDLFRHLPKIRKMFAKPNELTTLEKLVEQAMSKFTQNELIAWLRLLLARHEIEKEIGIRKSVGRPRIP